MSIQSYTLGHANPITTIPVGGEDDEGPTDGGADSNGREGDGWSSSGGDIAARGGTLRTLPEVSSSVSSYGDS